MLTITIPAGEFYDQATGQFKTLDKPCKLTLEHSLVSISKWESKWHVEYLTDKKKTREQAMDYIRCMTLTQNVDPEIYNFLTPKNIEEINAYINDPMTASSVTDRSKGGRHPKEKITSELIYYWMIANEIPMECQKWHLNRLLMLIKICGAKNQTGKMSKGEILKSNAAINAARRKASGSKG